MSLPKNMELEIPTKFLSSLGGNFDAIPINTNLALKDLRVKIDNSRMCFALDVCWDGSLIPVKGYITMRTDTTLEGNAIVILLNLDSPLALTGAISIEPHLLNGTLIFRVLSTSLSSSILPKQLNKYVEDILNARLKGWIADKVRITALETQPGLSMSCVFNNDVSLNLAFRT